MAHITTHGIDVILSESSERTVPTSVAYTTEQRLTGNMVVTQMRRNKDNSILFPTRFLGIDSQTQLDIEKAFVSHSVEAAPEYNASLFSVK